jgi:DNA polymerase-3 subunit delta
VHGLVLGRDATDRLVDLVGWEIGILDQELAKLVLFAEPDQPVSEELVQRVVGGWRTRTIWEMIDAAADGDAATAMSQLDQLLQAGETSQGLFGLISWSLRRFAAAVRIAESGEASGSSAERVLTEAGFRNWPRPGTLARAERQWRQIGKKRAGMLYRWLLETDLALKGSHGSRARWALELLILRLAEQQRDSSAPTGDRAPV